jgi:hypothetical protein
MFCQALHWGKPHGTPRPFAVGAPVGGTLTAHPVAQLGGLPVLRLDWPAERQPTITQRALTGQIAKVKREIDERVAELYGVES